VGGCIADVADVLDLLLRKAQSTLRALNVELTDEAAEAASPLTLPKRLFGSGILALPSDGDAA